MLDPGGHARRGSALHALLIPCASCASLWIGLDSFSQPLPLTPYRTWRRAASRASRACRGRQEDQVASNLEYGWPMNSAERHRLARRIFDEAIELEGKARVRYIARECAGDGGLKREVEELLELCDPTNESSDELIDLVGRAADDLQISLHSMPSAIGPYRVERELGRGGMGVVYLAVDTSLGRQVAIKTLPRQLVEDPQRLALLEREARIIASLSHPNIAAVHSLEAIEGRRVLIMEYVDGNTLEDRIASGRMEAKDAVDTALDLARALEAAHREGVVHRDIKPSNVMITRRGEVKVLDFGVAGSSVRDAWTGSARTVTSDDEGVPEGPKERSGPENRLTVGRAGTPRYMAPERFEGERGTQRGDIWAFGLVLFEMLSGSDGPNVGYRNGGDFDLSELPATTPSAVRSLISACLARDPDARPTEMSVVRKALESVSWREPDQTARRRSRVPVSPGSFIGRVDELEAVRSLVAVHSRVTLTGLGGMGKTRLAQGVATRAEAELSGSVAFVSLVSLDPGGPVASAIEEALSVADVTTEAESADGRRVLLVLDGCEHAAEICRHVAAELRETSPHVHILFTSRRPLGVSGEVLYRVPPLKLPSGDTTDLAGATATDAMRLFDERASAVSPGFVLDSTQVPVVARVCRRLDGVPLAIELAALRMATMSATEIERRLDRRFRLLVGGRRVSQTRHRTLRDVVDWGYATLDSEMQSLLCRLLVLTRPFGVADVERLLAKDEDVQSRLRKPVPDLLSALVDSCMLEPMETPDSVERRFFMIETVRAYIRERLRETDEKPPADRGAQP